MKLIFINGPYGYARDIKAMEIFRNAVDNAGWLDEKDSLVSGDMVGFNFGDDEVRATVETGKEIIEVHMIHRSSTITPGHCTCHFSAGKLIPKGKYIDVLAHLRIGHPLRLDFFHD